VFTDGDLRGSVADYQGSGDTKTVAVKEECKKDEKKDTEKKKKNY